MSSPSQKESMTNVWEAMEVVLRDLNNPDLETAMSPGEFFKKVHLFLLKGVAVYGPKFVTDIDVVAVLDAVYALVDSATAIAEGD